MDGSKGNEPMKKHQTTMVLEGDLCLVVERTFRAPPRMVFEAWTRAEHVKRWWAPKSRGVTIAECTADPSPGGKYRYVLRLPDGALIAFSGEYREVLPHTRIVYTQIFEAYPDAAVVVTVTLEDLGDETRLVSREEYPSADARTAALSAGMEPGMRETLEQLDDLVASMA